MASRVGRGARGAASTASTRPWCRPATPPRWPPRWPALLADADRRRARLAEAGRRLVLERYSGARAGRRARGPLRAADGGVKISVLALRPVGQRDGPGGPAGAPAGAALGRGGRRAALRAAVWRPAPVGRSATAPSPWMGRAAIRASPVVWRDLARAGRRRRPLRLQAAARRATAPRCSPGGSAAGRCCSTSTTGRSASSAAPERGARSAARSTSAIPTGCRGRG